LIEINVRPPDLTIHIRRAMADTTMVWWTTVLLAPVGVVAAATTALQVG
jgi:hypothetical protein